MKRKEAEGIIISEKLISYSFFENRNDAVDEMVIKGHLVNGLCMLQMKEPLRF